MNPKTSISEMSGRGWDGLGRFMAGQAGQRESEREIFQEILGGILIHPIYTYIPTNQLASMAV